MAQADAGRARDVELEGPGTGRSGNRLTRNSARPSFLGRHHTKWYNKVTQSGRAKARLMRRAGSQAPANQLEGGKKTPRQADLLEGKPTHPRVRPQSTRGRTRFFLRDRKGATAKEKKAMATQSLAKTAELTSEVLAKSNPFDVIKQYSPAQTKTAVLVELTQMKRFPD